MAGLGTVIEVTGIPEVVRKLENDKLLGPPIKKLLGDAGHAFERQAKMFSPVDTGRLRSSIMTEVYWDSSTPMASFASVFTEVEYASFVEYGKGHPRRIGRIPFWRPAFEMVKDKIHEYIGEAIQAIDTFWRS